MKLQSIPGSDVQYGIYLLFLQILVCYTGLSNIPTCWDSQQCLSYYTKTNKKIMTIFNVLFQESVNPPTLGEEDLHSPCSTCIMYMYTYTYMYVQHVHVYVIMYMYMILYVIMAIITCSYE